MPHLTSITHPEAILYHYHFGPKVPHPDDEEGTIWVEEEDDDETWVNNDVEAGEE